MATEVVSQLSNAIKMVQELRLSVTRVAEQLSCGMKKPTSEEAGAQSKEKLFLFDLQKNLLAVNTYMRYICMILSLRSESFLYKISTFSYFHLNYHITYVMCDYYGESLFITKLINCPMYSSTASFCTRQLETNSLAWYGVGGLGLA